MEVAKSLIFCSEVKEIFKKVSDKFDAKWQTRKRVLNTQILVTFLFKLIQSHNKQGYGSSLIQFWESCLDKNIILPETKTVSASSLCEARQKLPEEVFIELNQNLLVLWNKTQDLPNWKCYRIFAIDGSRVSLPRELINEGFIVCSADQGNYYRQGLMSCLYNIQEKVVYDFSLQAHLNERLSALEHIQQLGSKDVVVLDRGYFSYLMLYKIIEQNCHVIFRIPFGSRNNTNNEIMNFIETDQEDSTIDYMPSTTVMHDLKKDGYNLKFRPLKVRLIKHKINDTTYIYATTLTDKHIFPKECFCEIYHCSWSIEELYKVSKRFIEIEDFHAKSARGIKQELYAHILLINLSRFFEFEAEKLIPSNKSEDNKHITNTFDPISMIKINFKNCLLIVTRQLENLVMTGCILTNNTLQKIISSIDQVRQKVRLNRHYPRISRKPINRWVTSLSRCKFTSPNAITGMSEAIGAVFPKTEHQLCIVHQIRNSLRYVSYKDRKELAGDLKPIYTASTEKEALAALEAFETKWSKQYPQIAKSWYLHWDNLMIFLEYHEEIRKIIYTTNAVESVNSQLRKVIKNKRVFPNDNAVFKILYLAIDYMTKKWSMPIPNWNAAMAHFLIKFEERI